MSLRNGPLAAVFFQDDGFATSGERIAGRAISGHGFLRELAHADPGRPLVLFGEAQEQLDRFLALQEREPVAPAGKDIHWVQSFDDPRLATAGALHVHGLSKVPEFAWRRARGDARSVSLIGLNHTISDHSALDALGAYLTAPVQEWDAVVCTSRASEAAIRRILDDYADHLTSRFQAARMPRPHLEVIPLGIHCDDFALGNAERERLRQESREALGVPVDGLVVLQFGRLSHLGKAHPTPGFLALQEAACRLKRPVHLVLAGWFANGRIAEDFREAAAALCPDVRLHILDGRGAAVRAGIWHGADLFLSLSDTIQESFGITPLEAMAAGLPVVVSDWDGYRDTVRDGVGVRIPTYAPAAGDGQALADWYAEGKLGIDGYEGFAALATAVDVGRLVDALVGLLGNDEQRRAMGAAAARHVRERFDWAVVLQQHQALWAELAVRRARAAEPAPLIHPLRPDPFRQFGGHPTMPLGPDLRLICTPDAAAAAAWLAPLAVHGFAMPMIGFNETAETILGRLAGSPASVGELTQGLDGPARQQVVWSVGFLLKLGLVRVHSHV